MLHARGRPLKISTIGEHTAPPPAPSPTATTLSPPMSGEKAVIVRFSHKKSVILHHTNRGRAYGPPRHANAQNNRTRHPLARRESISISALTIDKVFAGLEMEKSWCELFVSHREQYNSQLETSKSKFGNYLKAIALNFAATALLMPHTRGRPLQPSTIGEHTAPPPAPSHTATTLSPPMSGEKAVIVRF